MNLDFDRLSRAAFVLLRVVTGFLFFQIGANKILGWYGGMPPDGSTAVFPTQMWIGGMLELVGGLAVLVGLFTRPVAFVLSGEMAVAYWQFHFGPDPSKAWPVENGGTPAVLFCFVFLYFAAAGAGPWSLDALLRRRRLAGAPPAARRTSFSGRTYEGSTVHGRSSE
jgi:putative oxidoreductase